MTVYASPGTDGAKVTFKSRYEHYIGGEWVKPHGDERKAIINPATGQRIGTLAMGDKSDVKRAVAAAKAAFPAWSQTSVKERVGYLTAILQGLIARNSDLAEAIMAEMGAPRALAYEEQAPSGVTKLTVERRCPAESTCA